MKALDFKSYGLEELSHKELQETEGGWILFALNIAILIYLLLR